MAVSHDVATESHTGTTGSTLEASFTWSHTGAASGVKGAWVLTFNTENTSDIATAVTYGGSALTAVAGGRAVDTLGEAGDCKLWFLGAAVPQGTQSVVVTRTNNGTIMYAVSATQLAATDLETTGIVLLQENQALAEQSVTDGSPGTNSLRYAGSFYGGAAVPVTGANSTALHGIDFGARTVGTVRETTAGQGARLVGFTDVADDVAAVHFAVREPAAAVTSPPRPTIRSFAATRAATY